MTDMARLLVTARALLQHTFPCPAGHLLDLHATPLAMLQRTLVDWLV